MTRNRHRHEAAPQPWVTATSAMALGAGENACAGVEPQPPRVCTTIVSTKLKADYDATKLAVLKRITGLRAMPIIAIPAWLACRSWQTVSALTSNLPGTFVSAA